jgi:hypothetical protein
VLIKFLSFRGNVIHSHGTVIRQKTNMKTFALVLCLALVPSTFAQIESGTVVIVGLSKNKIVMAADSRVGEEIGKYHDDGCKIVALSNKFLFTMSGRNRDRTNGKVGWDADQQAKEAFAADSQQPIPPSLESSFAYDLTQLWAELMIRNISKNIRPVELSQFGTSPNNSFVDGLFIGIGPLGDIQIGRTSIRRAPQWFWDDTIPDPLFVSWPDRVNVPETMTYTVLGIGSTTVNELFAATSERARNASLDILKEAKTWPSGEKDVRMAIKIAEFVTKYTDFPDDIGGPIDAAELDKGGTIRWIQRKPACKDE